MVLVAEVSSTMLEMRTSLDKKITDGENTLLMLNREALNAYSQLKVDSTQKIDRLLTQQETLSRVCKNMLQALNDLKRAVAKEGHTVLIPDQEILNAFK